jgi:uncharacterized membrane protein
MWDIRVLVTLNQSCKQGYVALEALFPKDVNLDWIERFALSIGLSLALMPLVGFLLSYASLGV